MFQKRNRVSTRAELAEDAPAGRLRLAGRFYDPALGRERRYTPQRPGLGFGLMVGAGTVSGLHCSIPKGTSAPGNVFPFAEVPVIGECGRARGCRTFTNGSTNRVRSRVARLPPVAPDSLGTTAVSTDASSAATQSEEHTSPAGRRVRDLYL